MVAAVYGRKSRHRGEREGFTLLRRRFGLAGFVAALSLVLVGLSAPAPALAADMAISISPASTTTKSGVATTYTLTYSCSNAGGSCLDSKATIPTGTVTGNGSNTDFASWVSTGTCPAVNKSVPGEVSFGFGTLATGTNTCTFRVIPPEYTTLNDATTTITPTLSSSNSVPATAEPATLVATAGHNNSINNSIPAKVITGNTVNYTISYACGLNPKDYSGDIGISSVVLTATLPANFDYQSASPSTSLPGTISFDPATRVLTYSDPTGKSCGNPPLNVSNLFAITVTGKASTDGVPDEVGSKICATASGSWTYIDGETGSGTTAQVCSTVIDLATTIAKSTFAPGSLSNLGQHPAADGGAIAPDTYPGDWDGSGAGVYYDIIPATRPAAANAGMAYDIKDPMPCLDNVANANYSSNEPGSYCANPAFVPTLIQPTGFSVTAANAITLVYTDGTTGTVGYTAAKAGWVIPTSPTVAEVDIPAFPAEGANAAANMRFRMYGYASASVPAPAVLTNTVSSTPYAADDTSSPLSPAQTSSSRLLVAVPPEDGAAYVYPGLTMNQVGTSCTVNVSLNSSTNGAYSNRIEIPTAPSQAIYIDYLAPAGTTGVNAPTTAFQLKAMNAAGSGGSTFSTAALAPTVVDDYNGTGRTLVRYTIPANTATVPGYYNIRSTSFVQLTLEAGCAGTYTGDITVGYGAPIQQCYFNNYVSNHIEPAPMYPTGTPDLRGNASPIADNYCGYSTSVKIAAVKPGFTVDKTVQGNLDPSPIGSGGTGHVSVDGGTATYKVSFLNSGESTLTDPVMYDLLPRIGDTRASSTAARNSQFAVTLTGLAALPAGLTVAYSQATNPCRAEVLFSNPGCVDDWSTAAPSPLSKTTALRFAYSGRVTVGSSFAATYTVSTPPAAAGSTAWNSVGTNAFAGDALVGKTGGAESSLTGLQAQSAQPAITKTADRATVDAVGQTITYTFTVTNNTAVTLDDVRVADALVDSAASSEAPDATCTALTGPDATCSGASTTLAPNQSAVFTASYVTTQADLDHGRISDQATVTADPPTGPSLSNSSDVVTVTAARNGALSLEKSASPGTVDSVGDTVGYTFRVTNTGNVTLKSVGIDEKSFSGSGALSSISCPRDALAPGASADCTASYPVTQADLTAGSIVNTAAATATTPANVAVTSADSTATVAVDQVASLAIVKSAEPSTAAAYTAGQPITYTFVVSNTGNVPVVDIAVNEVAFSGTGALSAIDCPATALDPAAQFSCTASYTLTQADIDAGSLTNTANATGTAATGPVTADDSTVTTPQEQVSKLTLVKTADTGFVNAAGDAIGYTFRVRNAGNVTITDVTVAETEFSGSGGMPEIACPTSTLVPGQLVDCTAVYTVTQADMDSGSVVNTAEAAGVGPGDVEVRSDESTATVAVNEAPAIALLKSADVESYDTVGTGITFSFLVTNTGNVTLAGVEIAEGAFTGSGELGAIDCPATELAPEESVTCEAGYETTQADLDRGGIANTATASALAPGGADVVSDASTATVEAVQEPALVLEKTVDPDSADASGDAVTYTFHVTNSGNVTLTGLVIAETAFTGTGGLAAPECREVDLAPGAEVSCTVSYRLTQSDVDAGAVTNTAVATASLGVTTVSSEPSTATVTIERTPALSLVKSASPAAPADFMAGEQITYSFVVTNTGNVTITEPAVQEGDFTGTGTLEAPSCPAVEALAPGEQLVCSTVYTVTQADIDAASVTNTATAVGNGPDGATPLTPPSSTVTVPEPSKPSLALLKTTDAKKVAAEGQIVTYHFTVTNTGNTTATKVGVKEDAFSGRGTAPVVDCTLGTLLPGQTASCSTQYTVVAADLDGRPLTNTATAFSVTPSGGDVSSDPSTATIEDVITAGTDAGDLARTGATIAWGAGFAALAMLAAGVVLTMIRRRRARH